MEKVKLTDNESYEDIKEYVLDKGWTSSQITARLTEYRNRLITCKKTKTREKTKLVISWLEEYNKEFSKKRDTRPIKAKAITLFKGGYSIIEVGESLGWEVSRTTLYKYKNELEDKVDE